MPETKSLFYCINEEARINRTSSQVEDEDMFFFWKKEIQSHKLVLRPKHLIRNLYLRKLKYSACKSLFLEFYATMQ